MQTVWSLWKPSEKAVPFFVPTYLATLEKPGNFKGLRSLPGVLKFAVFCVGLARNILGRY